MSEPSEPTRIQALNPDELWRLVERLQAQVGELERRNAALRTEVERLRRRQQRQTAPFSNDRPVAQPQRPGRKPGQGRFRHREAPTAESWSVPAIAVPVTESACPHCGGELDAEETEVATVTELPTRPQPGVRTYRVGVRRCGQCGRSVRGRHPDLAADQYGATAHRLGPRLLAAGHAMHYGQGVPMRKVPAILATLTG